MNNFVGRSGPLSIRFSPDNTTSAHLCFDLNKEKFISQVSGLVVNESFGGCCLVIVHQQGFLTEKQKCLVQYGDFFPILAEVRWIKLLDESIQKIGLEFLE